jgi:hypothetical protein
MSRRPDVRSGRGRIPKDVQFMALRLATDRAAHQLPAEGQGDLERIKAAVD